MTFLTGPDEATDLTDAQILAAVPDVHRRRAHRRRVRLRRDRHPVPAGAEGPGAGQRPGRRDCSTTSTGRRCAAATARVSSTTAAAAALQRSRRVRGGRRAGHESRLDGLGFDPETTLHDVRWGEEYDGQFVWVFEISGAAPAEAHRRVRQRGSERQPPMYFPLGGGTLNGDHQARRDRLVPRLRWTAALNVDLGRAAVDRAARGETERRWPPRRRSGRSCTPSRPRRLARSDDGAAQGQSPQVAYAPDADTADAALRAKAAMFAALGSPCTSAATCASS